MRILSLALSGYKRLLLNNIEYFKITPTEMIQLILGTNGSGKSSILRELTPLPPVAADYSKDGYKIIEIEHQNKKYVLTTDFSSAHRNSFVCEGEELNQSGTGQIQKELIKREFGITQEIHELLISGSTFNQMGPSERRHWFTLLCDTDYTFAIATYQKLRERLRDLQGGVKLIQSRLVQETDKLMNEEQVAKIKEDIKQLGLMIGHLMETKPSIQHTADEIGDHLTNIDNDLQRLAFTLVKLRGRFTNIEGFESLEDIEAEMINHQGSVRGHEMEIERISKEIAQHQKTYDNLLKANVDDSQGIETKLQELGVKIDQRESKLFYPFVFDDPVTAYRALDTVYDNLTTIFSSIEANADRQFSRTRFQELSEKLKFEQGKHRELEARRLDIIHKRKEQEHYREHNETECPRCQFAWNQGYDERLYQRLGESIIAIDNEVIKTEAVIKDTENALEQLTAYLNTYRLLSDVIRSWSVLNPFWDHLNATDLVFKEPRSCIYELERFKADLLIHLEIKNLKVEYSEILKVKELLEKDEKTNTVKLQDQLKHLNMVLFNAQTQRSLEQRKVLQLKEYKDTITSIFKISEQLETMLNERGNIGEDLVSAQKKKIINEAIRFLQLEQSSREKQLSEINIQQALVNDLKDQLSDIEKRAEVTKILVNELSPTDGLIAKGLLGFINNFISQMNGFIRKIWLYPLEIQSCQVPGDDAVDLDYKFALKVGDGDNTIQDISKGSSAMKEVIDLAFKVVSMKYLGLSDSPLFLDEFGHSMDSAHRQSAFYVISNLITQSSFPQIYIVSHFEDCYGSLKNAEVTVLSEANIVIPKDSVFNKHVIIK